MLSVKNNIGGSEVLLGIRIGTAPTKTSYKAGEALDLTGLKLQSITSDGDNETYTDITGWTTSPASGTTLYEYTSSILISWTSGGKTYTASQAITVTRVLTGLSITTPPTIAAYKKGAQLDLTGLVATATFNSGNTEDVTANCTFSPASGSTLGTVGTVTVTATYTENGITKTVTTTVEVTPFIYGVLWDGTATTKLSRTDDAADFTDPIPYISGATVYSSPFDNLEPWVNTVRVTDSIAGEVVKLTKFYYKITKTGSAFKLQISADYFDGSSVAPAFMDRGDGSGERDVVYVGRYHSCSTYKSTTGQSPQANITRSAARTSIHNLGSKVWQLDYAMRVTIQMLYLVEFADWNSQAKIGYGCSLSSAVMSMGYTDSMPYHTGTMEASRATYGRTQYRYIEGLWDNVFDWMDGCYYSGGMNIIKNPNNFSDTANGTLIGLPPGTGYISGWNVPSVSGFDWAIYPSAVSGGSSSYVPDYWSYGASGPCLYCGGGYGQYLYHGLWYVYCSGASSVDSSIGCRLQILP